NAVVDATVEWVGAGPESEPVECTDGVWIPGSFDASVEGRLEHRVEPGRSEPQMLSVPIDFMDPDEERMAERVQDFPLVVVAVERVVVGNDDSLTCRRHPAPTSYSAAGIVVG